MENNTDIKKILKGGQKVVKNSLEDATNPHKKQGFRRYY